VAEREAAWSPDGRRLAFYSQLEDPAGDIFIAELEAGDLVHRQNVTPWQPDQGAINPDVTPAWSPDGTWIAFTSYRSGGQTLWVMDGRGGQLRELTSADPNHGDFFPSWSPDGRWLAFQRLALDDSQVGILPVGGGSPTFFPFPGRAYSPAWSPDGAWIAFSGLVDGEYDIYLQSTTGDQVRRLVRPGADHSPAWWLRP
jgi:TolB protein